MANNPELSKARVPNARMRTSVSIQVNIGFRGITQTMDNQMEKKMEMKGSLESHSKTRGSLELRLCEDLFG